MALFLLALLAPSPLLVVISYLLRYRSPRIPSTKSAKRSSTAGSVKPSPYRSLALVSNSQLSLPISISPKLTPPAERRHTMNDGITKLLEPKPSVSNFGFSRPLTVYGVSNRDANAEEDLRRTLARRSGDVWLENGHAVEGGGLFARAAEMIKPVPAMRVLDSLPAANKQKRSSAYSQHIAMPEINVSSPSKYDKRVSGVSLADTYEHDHTMASGEVSAEIQTARYGRMSKSPTFFYGQGYEIDWMTAGVLPNLVPSIRIGPDVKVEPRPTSLPANAWSPPSKRHSQNGQMSMHSDEVESSTPKRKSGPTHSHGVSTSIDLTPSTQYHTAENTTPIRNRHKPALSLPTFSPDFSVYRKSIEEEREQGIDLPPIPYDLSTVMEESERSQTAYTTATVDYSVPSPAAFEDAESEDEAMAAEMEQVLKMDTPTRAEFVISPAASSYGRSSRASQRSETAMKPAAAPANLPPSLKATLKQRSVPEFSALTFDSPDPDTIGTAHPYPSRLITQRSLNSLPGHHVVAHPHPPLRMRKSNETLSTDNDPRTPAKGAFKPSKDELARVKQLKDRALASKQLPREFRPLQVVDQQRENRKKGQENRVSGIRA